MLVNHRSNGRVSWGMVFAGVLAFATLAIAGSTDFIVSSPAAGSVHYVGGTLLLQFTKADTSVHITQQVIELSVNGGRTFQIDLGLALNSSDSISLTGHYNWVIPDSMVMRGSVPGSEVYLSTVSEQCILKIANYQTHTPRGLSGIFSIRDSTQSVRFGIRASRGRPSADFSLVGALVNGRSQPVAVPAQAPAAIFSIDGRLREALLVKARSPRQATGGAAGMVVITSMSGAHDLSK